MNNSFELNGVAFNGSTEAAEHFGVSERTIRRWRKQGVHDRSVTIGGESFVDAKSAAEHFGVHVSRIYDWVKTGKTSKTDHSFEMDGKMFGSIKEAMDHFGVSEPTIVLWKRNGRIGTEWNRDKSISIFDRVFKDTREAAEFYGRSLWTVRRWNKITTV